MAVRQFTFDARLTGEFIRFGYDLYRDDRCWVAPSEDELRVQLSPEFIFYRIPDNRHARFMATCGNRTAGRVAAFVNHALEDRDGEPVGAVGFFESVEDWAAARDLFDSAVQWLCEEQGVRRIWGPMNFDIWHGYRLMTRGFDRKPFYGEPYNKPYYPDFFERYGFTPRQRWNSVEIEGRATLARLAEAGRAADASLTERGYRFESLDPARFQAELLKLHSVLSRSFSGFLGYTPIAQSEFVRTFFPARHAARPDFFRFAYDDADRLCGFVAGLLDVSDAVRAMRGRDHLIARSRFFYRRLLADRTMLHLLGKTPEEGRKQNGLGAALFSRAVRTILAAGYDTMIATLMSQGNPSRRFLQELADDGRREYVLYECNR